MTLIYVIIAIIINNCYEDYGDDSSEDGWNHIENFVNGTCMRACVVAQLCPTLCDPMDCSPAGSSVLGISQARILEWVVIPYCKESS